VRARPLALLALLLAPTLGGCLGDAEEAPRLAQPTDGPAEVPGRDATGPGPRGGGANATPPTPAVNFSDPGYVMTGDWHVGDAWYYESNASPWRYRSMRVLDMRVEPNRTLYDVEEAFGLIGQAPTARVVTVVDGTNWSRLRAADEKDTRILYEPSAATLRLFRNASAAWNETGVSPHGISWRDRHVVNAHYQGLETVALGWATVRAGRVEHRDFVTDAAGERRQVVVVRWVDRDVLNDVAIQTDVGPTYTLVGARVAGREMGRLVVP
jgi:hypothetical protein